jgi:putative ABC transport system substrate-binding protein
MHQTLTVRLIRPAIWAMLLAVPILTSDSGSTSMPLSIAYIGAWTPASDISHQKFLSVFKQAHPDLFSRVEIDYVQAPDTHSGATVVERALLRRPALVLAPTGASALKARVQAGNTPVIFASYLDPTRLGLVGATLPHARPVTGVSLADMLHLKRMELLRAAFPTARTVAVLVDQSWLDAFDFSALQNDARQRFGFNLSYFLAESAADFEALARRPEIAGFDAWYIPGTYVAYLAESQILALLRQLGKPAIHSTVQEVKNGAVMAYEQDSSFVFAALADLVARVLAGEDARTIPIERPRRYVLAVRADAEALALGMSPAMLRQADQVYVDAVGPAK